MTYSEFAAFAIAASMIMTAPAFAQDKKMDHSGHGSMKMDHSGHGSIKMEAPGEATEAEAKARINTVNAEAGMVNVDHGPIPEIGWPAMTMDIAVTRRVDLTTVKPGSDVLIKLKKGRDNQFRIVDIAPAQ